MSNRIPPVYRYTLRTISNQRFMQEAPQRWNGITNYAAKTRFPLAIRPRRRMLKRYLSLEKQFFLELPGKALVVQVIERIKGQMVHSAVWLEETGTRSESVPVGFV